MRKIQVLLLIFIVQISFSLSPVVNTRVKDICRLLNDRQNMLIGYGLVVGLQGTGDDASNEIARQGVANLLSNFGVNNLDIDNLKSKNTAVVMVTAKLGAFNMPGDNIDVQVSSLGQASSLKGGVLLFTPLKAGNGGVYAIAQGPVAVGGYSVEGKSSKSMKNHVASGVIPNGAIVENSVATELVTNGELVWILDKQDFNTAENIKNAIEKLNKDWDVKAVSAAQVSLKVPSEYVGREISLISMVEDLDVDTDSVARIIINERTGAIVMGGPVKIAPVVVAHQNLNISVKNSSQVVQPGAFAGGDTAIVETSRISVEEGKTGRAVEIVQTKENTIEQVVSVLNRIGMSPGDIISILQMMKEAGAVKAKLEII
ncbi:MAG: flagellar basal body P-ring protein FlgI [Candidatus Margulisbacteria bacterium]|nr:flagellar basal body P-ring protein FlgI [Candidatus Margulisiibacteriota bacterium]